MTFTVHPLSKALIKPEDGFNKAAHRNLNIAWADVREA